MERIKSKIKITISIDRNLNDAMNESLFNKSKYIEWLIYQDLKKHKIEKIKDLMI